MGAHKQNCQCVFHAGRRNHKKGCQCPAHSNGGTPFLRGRIPTNKKNLQDWLVENGHRGNAQTIKRRLIEVGLKEDICETCGLGPEWQGKKLVLQLDHVNGIATDWRIENLKVICPNCHTQTNTFAGANAKKTQSGIV